MLSAADAVTSLGFDESLVRSAENSRGRASWNAQAKCLIKLAGLGTGYLCTCQEGLSNMQQLFGLFDSASDQGGQ